MKTFNANKLLLILGITVILFGTSLVFSEPGTEDNPLVSLSYLEKRMDQIRYYIDEKISAADGGFQANQTKGLDVVDIVAGQAVIGENGTEIILRSGKATVIASELGGLCDVTQGKDLMMDEGIPANHLLIIARDDGRGARAVTDAIFMVRGKYEIR